jgi:hypothetical protein
MVLVIFLDLQDGNYQAERSLASSVISLLGFPDVQVVAELEASP